MSRPWGSVGIGGRAACDGTGGGRSGGVVGGVPRRHRARLDVAPPRSDRNTAPDTCRATPARSTGISTPLPSRGRGTARGKPPARPAIQHEPEYQSAPIQRFVTRWNIAELAGSDSATTTTRCWLITAEPLAHTTSVVSAGLTRSETSVNCNVSTCGDPQRHKRHQERNYGHDHNGLKALDLSPRFGHGDRARSDRASTACGRFSPRG